MKYMYFWLLASVCSIAGALITVTPDKHKVTIKNDLKRHVVVQSLGMGEDARWRLSLGPGGSDTDPEHVEGDRVFAVWDESSGKLLAYSAFKIAGTKIGSIGEEKDGTVYIQFGYSEELPAKRKP